jgi:hypothetical protein
MGTPRIDRYPWGLFSAVLLLIVLELVLRALNPLGILPGATDDERAYYAVVPELLAFGAPDVAIVGSSRARRGVIAPSLSDALAVAAKDVRVGNFGLDSARAGETEVIVRRLLEATPKPRLVVWPIAPRDLTPEADPPGPVVRYLWRPSDWWRSRNKADHSPHRHLPATLRNEASRHSWLMRYRPIVRNLIEGSERRPVLHLFSDLVLGDRDASPINGAIDPKHLTAARTVSRDVTPEGVRNYLGRAFTERRWPVNHQSRSLEEAVEALNAARIPVLLLELPTHPLMEEQLPRGTTKKFRRYMKQVAKRHRQKFVPFTEIDVEMDGSDFYEHSHVNYLGAQKYTHAITKTIVDAFPRERR